MLKQICGSVLLLAVMFGGLLSGCSTGNAPVLDPDTPITLEIWHYYNGPQKSAFDTMVAQFNESVGMEQGIVVTPFSQGNVDALSEKLLSSAAGDVGADPLPAIFATYADTAYELDRMDVLVNLDDYFTAQELEAYRPEFIAEGRFCDRGCLNILPVAKSVELLMVNLTDWERFAVDTGAELAQLATFEGVTSTAQAYYNWTDAQTQTPGDGKALFGRDAMANYMIIGAQQLGVELFSVDGDALQLGLDRTVLRRLWDNYYVPMVNGWFSSNGRFRSDEANLGGIIALVGSSSAVSYFPTEVAINDAQSYPIECVTLPAPRFSDGVPYAVQQGAGMAVTKSSPTQEYASTLFLKWLTEPEQSVAFSAASGGYLPVVNEALNMDFIDRTLSEMYPVEKDYLRMHNTFSAAMQQISDCALYTPPPFPGNLSARTILDQSLNDLAKEDRQAVLNLMAQGLSQDEAMARFCTDAHFDTWVNQLTTALEHAVTP